MIARAIQAAQVLSIGFLTALSFAGCRSVDSAMSDKDASVVYALGSREGFVSPLEASLKPACPALSFSGNSFSLNGGHGKTLSALARGWSAAKPRYVIAGYASPELPPDYARALSERRAQAVRQRLIEGGVEADHLQTVGFGRDSNPSSQAAGLVVIFEQPQA